MPSKDHQFKVGNPGGPGRPKGKSLTARIEEALASPSREPGKDRGQIIAEVLVHEAEIGNMKAIEMILDRVDGKVSEKIMSDPALERPRLTIPGLDARFQQISTN